VAAADLRPLAQMHSGELAVLRELAEPRLPVAAQVLIRSLRLSRPAVLAAAAGAMQDRLAAPLQLVAVPVAVVVAVAAEMPVSQGNVPEQPVGRLTDQAVVVGEHKVSQAFRPHFRAQIMSGGKVEPVPDPLALRVELLQVISAPPAGSTSGTDEA